MLAGPIIGMMVSRMLMGFIDFVMVSRLGTEAQAAISPASIFVFTIACLGLGIANAVQTFVAQADGRGEPRAAGAFAWQSFYVAGACGLLAIPAIMTTGHWFPWLARLGNHSATVTAMEIDYIQIAMASVTPSIVCVGLNGFFHGVQRPGITLVAVLVSLVVNLFGNWLLIYGNLGFPRMEIAGAAVATVIAWFARTAVLLGAMLLPAFDRRYNTRRSFAFCWVKMKGLLRIGGPTTVQWLVDIGSWTVFMVLIVPLYGTIAMAASNVGLQLMHLSFMPAVGIGIALCSQVGFAIGEGDREKAVLRTRVALRFTVLYMGATGLLFLLGRFWLMSLFNEDAAVIAAGSYVLIWAAVFQVFDAMSITYMNALRGAGDTRWPAIMIFILCWGVFVGGGYAVARSAPDWGLSGPWAMCTLYIVVLGIVLWLRWRAGHWRKIRLFGAEARRGFSVVPETAPATADAADQPVSDMVGSD